MKALLALFAMVGALHAQDKPLASPKSVLTQTIGTTEVTITYHRPGVKGRTVFGSLVPYGKVWRTGANENTTISFSKDVKIDGKPLKAGTYGLHSIPQAATWTLIFSHDAKSWGSYSYDEKKDALRITVTASSSEFVERMRFTIDDMTDTQGTITLQWEKVKVSFVVEV